VETVSGMTLDRYFAEHITGPLGMRDTAFGIEAAEVHRLAEPQRDPVRGHVPAVAPYDPARPAKWFSGGGGLLSTAADYARFGAMLLNEGTLDGVRLLARKTVHLMTSNHLPAGLGCRSLVRGMDWDLACARRKDFPRCRVRWGISIGAAPWDPIFGWTRRNTCVSSSCSKN
jgi:CubicO group peptidase (beta-lactamase class C family)